LGANEASGEAESPKITPIDKPAISDPALEKKILEVVKKQEKDKYKVNTKQEPQKILLRSEEWKLHKNDYGTILYRYRVVDILEKTTKEFDDFKVGDLFMCRGEVKQAYYYGTTFADTIEVDTIYEDYGSLRRLRLNQEDAQKALAGDFSFVKE